MEREEKYVAGPMDGSNCCDCGCAMTVSVSCRFVYTNPETGVSEWRTGYMCGDCIARKGADDHQNGEVIRPHKVQVSEGGSVATGILPPK